MPREVPPPLEMICLNALWTLREGNVADVRRLVAESRPLAYTTVMTLLERLARKGIVSRRKVGRAFLYTPAVPQEALQRAALQQFLDCFFGGSREKLLSFLGEGTPPLPVAAPSGNGVADRDHMDTTLL